MVDAEWEADGDKVRCGAVRSGAEDPRLRDAARAANARSLARSRRKKGGRTAF